jgi:hypothetical protein
MLLAILLTPIGVMSVSDIEKDWATQLELAQTDAYGDGDTPDLAADQAYDDSNTVNLASDGYEGAQITFTFDSSGTTDNIIASVFASYDGTNFDDVEYWSIECDATSGASTQLTFLVRDIMYFKVSVKTTGTTDTFDYELLADRWNWEY